MLPRMGSLVLFGLGLFIIGCDSPPELMPVAPPGIEVPRVPPPTSGSGSEALGETVQYGGGKTSSLSTTIAEPTPLNESKKAGTGLTYTTLRAGTGETARPGDEILVHYVGRLADGVGDKKFDSSYDKGEPLPVEIGAGKALKGWDLGIPGMKVGEKRHLVIPSDQGYGAKGAPPAIPPNANLMYEIELLQILKPYKPEK